jgi:hypothetical protein
MALELTERELLDLGFELEETTEGSSYKIIAKKWVGDNQAFFLYENKLDTYLWKEAICFINFEIVVESDRGYITVIDNIETLERFHELENVLNKK